MEYAWSFNSGREQFAYLDDAFRFTSAPAYASGALVSSGGYGGSGALSVRLGGVDDADVVGMSGGWKKSFTLDQQEDVTLTFRYKMSQSPDYEPNEYSEVLVALDGALAGVNGVVARFSGDGNGGPTRSTGWREVTIELGELAPGRHELVFGGFNNMKTDRREATTILFDDISLKGAPMSGGGEGDGDGDGGGEGDGGSGGAALEAFEARVLELTNAFRVANGRDPLENDARLNAAAEDWSRDMGAGDFFRHSSTAQVEQFGYDWRAWGENIAAGQQTPEAVVNGWINSPGHRANMLSARFEEIGIGHHHQSPDAGSVNYRHYWTQVFGTEADSFA